VPVGQDKQTPQEEAPDQTLCLQLLPRRVAVVVLPKGQRAEPVALVVVVHTTRKRVEQVQPIKAGPVVTVATTLPAVVVVALQQLEAMRAATMVATVATVSPRQSRVRVLPVAAVAVLAATLDKEPAELVAVVTLYAAEPLIMAP
jgi:hypothetical protein